jgi:bla regulator protein blaR1
VLKDQDKGERRNMLKRKRTKMLGLAIVVSLAACLLLTVEISAEALLDEALLRASQVGDIANISRMLDAGANVNAVLAGDGSPLIAAARGGHLEATRLLLDRGGDPNLPVRGDGNPLIMAARKGHIELVALLLDRGAASDQVVPGDENALIQASTNGHLDVVKLLVGHGANVNARVWVDPTPWQPNGEWRTPLTVARQNRHEAVFAFLLSAGARE